MDFEEWRPLYEDMIDDFSYSEERDIEAAELLSEYRGTDGLTPLRTLRGEDVEISGPFYNPTKSKSEIKLRVAAGASLEQMMETGVEPDLMVTDLDGNTELQLELNLKGIPVIMHAHGDNMDLIRGWSRRFEGHVISTCQCEPPKRGIHNFGGFTDGDRAAFIADHFGAEEIILNGWNFEEPYEENDDEKVKKLEWAEKLLGHLDTSIKVV
ncbi:MAG: DUF115 domain-containing protein [Candidatus Thermoplasmatota archaeon]|nr:DUF115 domain-containing protein [Candidatus Thermoplasmatota archaeon]